MKIVFVCTGNTCRSPMAEALLKHKLKEKKIKGVKVSSCGLSATGEQMSELAAAVLEENKIKFKASPSKQISDKIIADADAVICMTPAHTNALKGQNCVDFTMLYGIEPIFDPYGGSINDYRRTLSALSRAITLLVSDVEGGTLEQKIKISIVKSGR